jgi:hypothetical protein
MPEERVKKRARNDAAEGKAPSTQAGEFVHEEIEHVRQGKHGARSAKQAIAIGLSKARRAGVKLPPPKDTASPGTKRAAKRDSKAGEKPHTPSPKRQRASSAALRREPHAAGSHRALSRQAKKVARTKGPAKRSSAAKKAARTRRGRRQES